jgi:hypothetical protein
LVEGAGEAEEVVMGVLVESVVIVDVARKGSEHVVEVLCARKVMLEDVRGQVWKMVEEEKIGLVVGLGPEWDVGDGGEIDSLGLVSRAAAFGGAQWSAATRGAHGSFLFERVVDRCRGVHN